MKKLKLFLIISLLINLIMVSGASLVIYKKGGISFLKNQVNAATTSQEYTNYYLQKKDIFESVSSSNVDLAFVGDSITDHGEFSEYFKDYVVVNRGISADNSKGVANRIDEVASRYPEKVFIMIGANDVTTPDEEYIKNLQTIISSFEEDTEIFIQSVLPINEDKFIGLQTNERMVHLNEILKNFSTENDITFIDLHSKFVDENNQLLDSYTYDGIHLTGEAYEKWVEIISTHVNK